MNQLDSTNTLLSAKDITAIPDNNVVLTPDKIGLIVEGDPKVPRALTIQTVNETDWHVRIDDKDLPITSIGGQLGVLLPSDTALHTVEFYYAPYSFLIGAIITLLACLLAIFYLLRADRLIPPSAVKAGVRLLQTFVYHAKRILLDTSLFEPRTNIDE